MNRTGCASRAARRRGWRRRAFTLLEIVFAVSVLMVVLVPTILFWLELKRQILSTAQELKAATALATMLERLRAVPYAELPVMRPDQSQLAPPLQGVAVDPGEGRRPVRDLDARLKQALGPAPEGMRRYVWIEERTPPKLPAKSIVAIVEFTRLPHEPASLQRAVLGTIRQAVP